MISPIGADWIFLVEASGPHLTERSLNAAVDVALQRAMKDGRFGDPSTHDGHAKFTVALSPAARDR